MAVPAQGSTNTVGFSDPPQNFGEIAPSEIHVWLARLDVPAEHLERYATLLAPDEKERAQRFHFERDRGYYTAARGILRLLLGRYTRVPAQALRFTYNAHGKPALPQDHPCRFNLGHSYGLAVFGFTFGRNVGVDIEKIRPDFAADDIAQRFFSPAEAAALRTVPDQSRAKAFFDCWTRKEAFIKGMGLGVFLGLHKFAVSLRPDEKPALLSYDDDAQAADRWTMFELYPPEGYVGAVAVEGKELTLRCWTWNASCA